MRRKIVGAVLVMIAGFLTVIVDQQAAHATVSCKEVLRWDDGHFNDGSTGDDDWYIKYAVGYRYCNDTSGPNWVKVLYSIGMYDQEGTTMSCDPFFSSNVLNGVFFNPYFWDLNGRNFNPGEFKVPCDPSTTNSKFVDYGENAPRLYFVNGDPPKFKANFKVDKSGIFFEPSGTLSGLMRSCGGRASSPC